MNGGAGEQHQAKCVVGMAWHEQAGLVPDCGVGVKSPSSSFPGGTWPQGVTSGCRQGCRELLVVGSHWLFLPTTREFAATFVQEEQQVQPSAA